MAHSNATAPPTRRILRFNSLDDVLVDVERIVASDRAGTLTQLGAWTPGQTFGHLATWTEYAYQGYPFRIPWFARWLVARTLRNAARNGMPPGLRLPGVRGGTYGTEPLETAAGADRLRAALAPMQRGEPPRFPHPALGVLPLDFAVQLNLRHAELHLSFLAPAGAGERTCS